MNEFDLQTCWRQLLGSSGSAPLEAFLVASCWGLNFHFVFHCLRLLVVVFGFVRDVGGCHVSRTCHTPGESQELPIRHGSGSLVEDRWQHWKSPHFQFLNNNQWPPAEELRLLAAGSGTHRARQEKRKTYPKSWRQFQREFLNLIKNLFLKSKVAMSWQKFEF